MTDRSLYSDFKSGRLDLMYSDFYPALIAYAVRFLGPKYAYLAEDCVQESIFKTYLVKDRIADEPSLKAYIYTSVRNRAIGILRKDSSHNNYLKQFDLSEKDILASLIERETMRRLFIAIDSLPEQLRRIFDMSFEEGLKNREIAAMLGISESAVKKRKARMLSLLRDAIGPDEETAVIALLVCILSRTA